MIISRTFQREGKGLCCWINKPCGPFLLPPCELSKGIKVIYWGSLLYCPTRCCCFLPHENWLKSPGGAKQMPTEWECLDLLTNKQSHVPSKNHRMKEMPFFFKITVSCFPSSSSGSWRDPWSGAVRTPDCSPHSHKRSLNCWWYQQVTCDLSRRGSQRQRPLFTPIFIVTSSPS